MTIRLIYNTTSVPNVKFNHYLEILSFHRSMPDERISSSLSNKESFRTYFLDVKHLLVGRQKQ